MTNTINDIIWREPDDYWRKPFFPENTAYYAVLLLEKTTDVDDEISYEIILAMGRDGTVFSDAPLADMKFGGFNPDTVKRWALIEWRIEENPFW